MQNGVQMQNSLALQEIVIYGLQMFPMEANLN